MDTSSSDDSSIEGILENGFPSSKMKNDRPTVGSGDDEYSTDSSYEFSSKLDEIEENGATSTGLPDIISEKSTGYTQPSNAPAYTIRAFELPTMPYISATLNSLHSQEELQHPKVISETDKISNIFGKHTMRDHEQFISHREKLECSLTKYFSKLAIVDQICVEQFEEEQTAPFPLRALKQTCMCDFPEDSECSICKQKLSDLASLCDSALDVMDEIYDCLVESTKSKTFPLSITRFTRETLERIIKSNENFESRSVPNSSLYRMIYRDELADNNPNSTVTEYIFQRICNRHSQFQIANIAEELSIIGKTHENATEKSSRKDITENNKKKKGLVKQSNRSPAGGSVRSRITKETSKNNTLKDSPASRTRSKIDSPASRTRSKSSKIINSNEKGKDSKITVIKRKRKSLDGSQFIY